MIISKPKYQFPGDVMDGAWVGGWSTRQLSRDAQHMPCIELQRGSDNATEIFGFRNGWLDTKAILAWGGSEMRVKSWFDQSGNNYHYTESTYSAMPTLVTGGNIVTQNGRPMLMFDGANRRLNMGGLPAALTNGINIEVQFMAAVYLTSIDGGTIWGMSGEGPDFWRLGFNASITPDGYSRIGWRSSDSYTIKTVFSSTETTQNVMHSFFFELNSPSDVAQTYRNGALIQDDSPAGANTFHSTNSVNNGFNNGGTSAMSSYIGEGVIWGLGGSVNSQGARAALMADQGKIWRTV